MKTLKFISLWTIVLFLMSCQGNRKQADTETQQGQTISKSWQEEFSYTLGYQAYLYAYSLLKMSELRYDWVTNPDASFYAPLNFFHHKEELANHINCTIGGGPNQDAQYSIGWMDLTDGPVILTHPEMGNRYFVFEIADIFSDNFAYVGKLTTGGNASAYALIPPGWKGELPKDISGSFQSPTNSVLIVGRTLVQDEEDIPNVIALQKEYHMIPLEYWGKDLSTLPVNRNVFKPYDRSSDPMADWKTIVSVWKESPITRDTELIKLFKYIGIAPDCTPESLDKLPEPMKKGLIEAAKRGRADLADIFISGGFDPNIVNGWMYPPKGIGRLGLKYDFASRAAIQCEKGNIVNDAEEATYLNTPKDFDGNMLRGGKAKYEIHYTSESTPKATEFYSLSIYNLDGKFVPNDIMRYSIGDRTKGIKKAEDGSYTVYIQSDEPSDPDKRANWLPSPKDDEGFFFVLRIYGPDDSVVEQTWAPPKIVRVD